MANSGRSHAGGAESTGSTTGEVDREMLVRYMNDGLAAMRMGMRAYESTISHVSDEDVRVRLGEFKADAARSYELGRVAIRSLGGSANKGKETLASMSAAVNSAFMGAGRDAYAEAREVKNLIAGESQALFDYNRTLEFADRLDHEATRRWAKDGVETAKRHLEYLEPKAKEFLERAILSSRRATPTTRAGGSTTRSGSSPGAGPSG